MREDSFVDWCMNGPYQRPEVGSAVHKLVKTDGRLLPAFGPITIVGKGLQLRSTEGDVGSMGDPDVQVQVNNSKKM
jgi:hypothetical protein